MWYFESNPVKELNIDHLWPEILSLLNSTLPGTGHPTCLSPVSVCGEYKHILWWKAKSYLFLWIYSLHFHKYTHFYLKCPSLTHAHCSCSSPSKQESVLTTGEKTEVYQLQSLCALRVISVVFLFLFFFLFDFLDAVYLFAILPGSHLGFHSYSSLNCRRCTDTETHAYHCLRCYIQYKQRSGQEVLFEGFEVPQSFLYFAILKSGKELISLLFIYFTEFIFYFATLRITSWRAYWLC